MKIAKGINSIEVSKEVWPKNNGGASKCNQIFKANYDLINSADSLG
jgi:hypothetical protein